MVTAGRGRPSGRASMSVFKSLDRSTVVTSTVPFSTTTTRFDTPYITTVESGACTTLSRESTAWTWPCDRVARVVVRTNAVAARPRCRRRPSRNRRAARRRDCFARARRRRPRPASRRRRSRECRARERAARAPPRGCSRRTSSRKSPTRPDEDPRVPEVAVAPHLLGAGAVGFLDESRDARHAALQLVPGLDVAEARVGPRRNDADRDERVMLLGDFGARGPARAETRPDRRPPNRREPRSSSRPDRRAGRSPGRPRSARRRFRPAGARR